MLNDLPSDNLREVPLTSLRRGDVFHLKTEPSTRWSVEAITSEETMTVRYSTFTCGLPSTTGTIFLIRTAAHMVLVPISRIVVKGL